MTNPGQRRRVFDREQKAKIREIQSRYRNARFAPGPWHEGDDAYRRLQSDATAGILALLTPQQKKEVEDIEAKDKLEAKERRSRNPTTRPSRGAASATETQ